MTWRTDSILGRLYGCERGRARPMHPLNPRRRPPPGRPQALPGTAPFTTARKHVTERLHPTTARERTAFDAATSAAPSEFVTLCRMVEMDPKELLDSFDAAPWRCLFYFSLTDLVSYAMRDVHSHHRCARVSTRLANMSRPPGGGGFSDGPRSTDHDQGRVASSRVRTTRCPFPPARPSLCPKASLFRHRAPG